MNLFNRNTPSSDAQIIPQPAPVDYEKLNHKVDFIQKKAWRLVRAAEDRFGAMKGGQKREWCLERLLAEFPDLKNEADDFVRSAFIIMKIEMGITERGVL